MRIEQSPHPKAVCAGDFCPFHNPSAHLMTDWPMNLRLDRSPLIERMCPHGIGHPDPDSLAFIERADPQRERAYEGIHGCDGCCSGDRS